MAIAVECDICGKQYKLNDSLAGKKVNCKACGSAMQVPGGDDDDVMELDDRPVRRKSGGKKSGKGKKSSGSMGLIIGGGLAAVVVGAVVIFAVVKSMGGGNPQAAQPAANPPAHTGGPVAVAPGTVPITPTTPAAGTPATPTTPPTSPATATKPPAGVNAAEFATGNIVTAAMPLDWKAQADPPTEPLPTEWANKFDIEIKARRVDKDNLTYPVVPSPFVIVGDNDDPKKGQRELWNLATGKKVGTLSGVTIYSSHKTTLSPDGRYFAWGGFGEGIDAYDFQQKKNLGTLPVKGAEFNLHTMAFVPGDRLIAASHVHRSLRVWQMPKGELLHETKVGDKFGHSEISAYSPGGKYIALESDFLEREIRLYEIATGAMVGGWKPVRSKDGGNIDLNAMAFSPDGSQLASVWDATATNSATQIVIWNMSDGTVAENILVKPGIKEKYDPDSQALNLQWFPDGKRFLVHGLALIDRAKRQTIYSFEKNEVDSRTIRRPLAPNLLAAFEGNHQKGAIKSVTISDEELNRAANLADVGGLPEDIKLPMLSKSDFSGAATPRAATTWNASPDPAPVLAAEIMGTPLPLTSGAGTIRDVVVTGGATPKAFVRVAEGENLKDSKLSYPDTRFRSGKEGVETITLQRPIVAEKNRVTVFDLTNRKAAEPIEIPFSADLVGATDDAVLVKPHNAKGRLDVYDAGGKHIVGFRPYKGVTDEDDLELRGAGLVDGTHVVTTNLARRLIGWELPACTPTFAVEEVTTVALSPGRRDIACATEQGIEIRDARTGEGRGTVVIQGAVRALAFHPNGEQLAILIAEKGGNYLFTADLKTGAIGAEIPSPIAGERMRWCGDKHLLIYSPGQRTTTSNPLMMGLFDIEAKTVAWSYKLPAGVMVSNVVDGRCWYAAPKSERVPALQLVATALPEPKVVQALSANKLAPELLVQPGGQVSLTMNVPGMPWQGNLAQNVQDNIKKAIEKTGVGIGSGPGIKVEVVAKPSSGKAFQVSQIGDRNNVTNVQENNFEMTVKYLRGQETVWQTEFRSSNNLGFGIKHLTPGQSIQQAFDDDLSKKITQYCESLVLPAYVFSRRSASGLGTTTLNGDGPVTGPVSKSNNDPVAMRDRERN